MALTVGSLFSGFGGLDMAVLDVAGGQVAWHCENDPDASAVLAHHWPQVPNLGDITAVDWAQVEPVDVLAAGWPCQDISNAGKRAGIEGARSGLWRNVAEAIGVLRPRYVALENVSAVIVRGLDRVLADLATLGFDAEWTCLRASAVGACHRRDRFFLVAADTRHRDEPERSRQTWREAEQRASERTEPRRSGETAADTDEIGRQRTGETRHGRSGPAHDSAPVVDWQQFTPAIDRWARILGRPAPAPTVIGRRGGRVLNPALGEWMMGLESGHVTGVDGLSRNAMLRILGNGVVKQQAATALRWLGLNAPVM